MFLLFFCCFFLLSLAVTHYISQVQQSYINLKATDNLLDIWNFWYYFAVVYLKDNDNIPCLLTLQSYIPKTKVLFPVQWCLFQQYSLWENQERLGFNQRPFSLWFMVQWLGNVTLTAMIAALYIINKCTDRVDEIAKDMNSHVTLFCIQKCYCVQYLCTYNVL